jgi:diguanylate cyclase (GGDEF)-like protein
MRHRFTIWDVSVLLLAAGTLLFLSVEYDVLRVVGLSSGRAETIELGEAILIALVLAWFLFVTLRRARAQQREVQRRTAAERKARELAFEDPLTGLPNRRQFDAAVADAFAAPPGVDRAHAVLLLDLNGFKRVNDVFGHPAGDSVLRVVASRLAAVMRGSGDLVSRLGGDEFGILATHVRSPEDASNIALRVIAALNEPVMLDETTHNLGVGIGIALFPRDGGTPAEVVRRADVALYRAKAEPGSGLRFFEEEMDVQLRERTLIESELRRAVAAGAIRPHYQPIVDLGSGMVTGFEALARWHHSLLGEVAPERFIPIAEESGLIRRLSEQLLTDACREAMRWPAGTMLSVNVSPAQLRDPGFGLSVLGILGETGLAPGRLEVEVSENALVRDLHGAEAALGPLRDAGVRIALDDFGTGYSSLYHLRNFKVDRIKIDRTFIERMEEEGESAAIVRLLLGLGHGLGVKVTAEGVESTAQRETLLSQGCDEAQGHLFSHALSAEEAAALLGTQDEHAARSEMH